MIRTILIVGGAALLAPAGAIAATASVDRKAYTTFEAAQGEANHVTGSILEGGAYRFADAGAAITVGSGCTSVSAGEASCEVGRKGVVVRLGDGDDTGDFSAEQQGVFLDGGAGDDVLEGSPGYDDIRGGAGRDVIRAGDGDDTITGSPGDRIFAGAGDDLITTVGKRPAGAVSEIDCGLGTDLVSTLRGDLIDDRCDRWMNYSIVVKTHAVLTGRSLVFRASCNAGYFYVGHTSCSGRLQLRRADGAVVGVVRYAGTKRRRFSVAFPVGSQLRRALGHGAVVLGLSEDDTGFKMLQRG